MTGLARTSDTDGSDGIGAGMLLSTADAMFVVARRSGGIQRLHLLVARLAMETKATPQRAWVLPRSASSPCLAACWPMSWSSRVELRL